MQPTSFSQLSRQRQILIRLCQRVNYGSILNLQLADGEVSFGVPPEVVLDLKLDADFKRRPEIDLADFVLCAEICRLLAQIDSLKSGVIETIVIHEGLPRRVVLRGPVPEAHT